MPGGDCGEEQGKTVADGVGEIGDAVGVADSGSGVGDADSGDAVDVADAGVVVVDTGSPGVGETDMGVGVELAVTMPGDPEMKGEGTTIPGDGEVAPGDVVDGQIDVLVSTHGGIGGVASSPFIRSSGSPTTSKRNTRHTHQAYKAMPTVRHLDVVTRSSCR